jgi:hypothetical protein
MRFFNTTGPVNCQDHYCLPPLTRFDLAQILSLISQKKYFVIHAPRQSGKTSCMLALRDHLNREKDYTALYFNVESSQSAKGDVGRGMKAISTRYRSESHLHSDSQEAKTQKKDRNAMMKILTSINYMIWVFVLMLNLYHLRPDIVCKTSTP